MGSLTIQTTIEQFDVELEKCKKEMKHFAKKEEYAQAIDAAEKGKNAATRLFKLGLAEYDEDIKSLSSKIAEFKKGPKTSKVVTSYYQKENIIQAQKELEQQKKSIMKSTDIGAKNEWCIRQLILSNQLFKFGQTSASANIKKSHIILDKTKVDLKKASEEVKSDWNQRCASLKLNKDKFLEMGSQFEQNNQQVESLIAYQHAFDIYAQLGDTEKAVSLATKIENITLKIPEIHDKLQKIQVEANIAKEKGQMDAYELLHQKQIAIRKSLYLKIPKIEIKDNLL